jgi:protein pelota
VVLSKQFSELTISLLWNVCFAVVEVLMDPAVVTKMADTKASSEVRALESFYTMLQTEPAKAFYGPKHVKHANEAQAVETLLISDHLFR